MKRMLFISIVVLFSCKEQPKEPTREERINQISAPLIANEVGEMDLLIKDVKDKSLTQKQRLNAYGKLYEKYPEYLYHLTEIVPYKKAKIEKPNIDEEIRRFNDPNYSNPESDIFLDSLSGSLATYWFNQQRKFIEEKYRKYAEQIVYKQDLQKQYSNH